jgi:hypothetical protein
MPHKDAAARAAYGRKYREKNRDRLLKAKAEYRAANKDFLSLSQAEWRKKNGARKMGVTAAWRAKNKDRIAEKARAYAAANPDLIKKISERYRKRNLAYYASRAASHRAGLIRATPIWARDFFIEEAYHLAALRTKITGYEWHVDHIVPLRSTLVCGLHVEHNLQVIPGSVNQSKNNRHWPDMP